MRGLMNPPTPTPYPCESGQPVYEPIALEAIAVSDHARDPRTPKDARTLADTIPALEELYRGSKEQEASRASWEAAAGAPWMHPP